MFWFLFLVLQDQSPFSPISLSKLKFWYYTCQVYLSFVVFYFAMRFIKKLASLRSSEKATVKDDSSTAPQDHTIHHRCIHCLNPERKEEKELGEEDKQS